MWTITRLKNSSGVYRGQHLSPPIKEHDLSNVVQANDIFLQNVRAGKNVAVESSFVIKESSE